MPDCGKYQYKLCSNPSSGSGALTFTIFLCQSAADWTVIQ